MIKFVIKRVQYKKYSLLLEIDRQLFSTINHVTEEKRNRLPLIYNKHLSSTNNHVTDVTNSPVLNLYVFQKLLLILDKYITVW
jgi:hypothetical protein